MHLYILSTRKKSLTMITQNYCFKLEGDVSAVRDKAVVTTLDNNVTLANTFTVCLGSVI